MNVNLDQIRMDGGTQPRAAINGAIVAEYAEDMRQGAEFPRVVLFFDGTEYWLADGFHRVEAARQAGRAEIDAEIRQGDRRKAVLFSVGANANHGFRRTNEDKRRAVTTLLNDDEWRKWPQTKIAGACGVSPEYVSRLKASLSIDRSIDKVQVERNGKVYEMQTANIGQRIDNWAQMEGAETEGKDIEESPQIEFERAVEEAKAARRAGFDVDLPEPANYGLVEPESAVEQEGRAPHVANNSGNNEWYTPPEYLEAARAALEEIDLDPASCELANRNVRAAQFYSIEDDGLSLDWAGRVWMNPPYSGDLIGRFIDKLIEQHKQGNVAGAIVLVNNATETGWFQALAAHASAICFPKGRIKYLDSTGRPANTPLQGQAFVYLGDSPARFRKVFQPFGVVVEV